MAIHSPLSDGGIVLNPVDLLMVVTHVLSGVFGGSDFAEDFVALASCLLAVQRKVVVSEGFGSWGLQGGVTEEVRCSPQRRIVAERSSVQAGADSVSACFGQHVHSPEKKRATPAQLRGAALRPGETFDGRLMTRHSLRKARVWGISKKVPKRRSLALCHLVQPGGTGGVVRFV